jgi:hypothetical protein
VLLRKKRKEAWINLMKIISQLMNSLTPIRSLSQNLLQIVDQDHLETEDFEDIKSSISTIINRAIICSFVELSKVGCATKQNQHQFICFFEDCLKMMSPIFESKI